MFWFPWGVTFVRYRLTSNVVSEKSVSLQTVRSVTPAVITRLCVSMVASGGVKVPRFANFEMLGKNPPTAVSV